MTDETKKKKKTSPTERSLKRLRDNGAFMVAVVEKWNRFGGQRRPDGTTTGIRVDLFGFIDLLAVMPGQVGTLGIQACAAGDLSKRIRKVIDDSLLRQRAIWYTRAGNKLVFWGWKQNKKTKRWELIERDFISEYQAAQEKAAEQIKLFNEASSTEGKDHDPF